MIGLFGMASTVKAIFAKNLIRKMTEAGLNGSALASQLDVSTGIVSRWVNGKSFPEAEILDKMRTHLGWTAADLLSEKDREPGKPNIIDVASAFVTIAEALGFERPKLKKKPK